jgi:hypothetical protein
MIAIMLTLAPVADNPMVMLFGDGGERRASALAPPTTAAAQNWMAGLGCLG